MQRENEYMFRAIELAKRGCGHVNPNPMVGAVIVKDKRIIGEGWHEKFGQLHAERNALASCKENPAGATIYVTLEPCCHWGRTPPCTDAIIQAGIKKVVMGSDDPNPLVAGKGIKMLRDAGIEVETGILKNECDSLNRVFFHYIKTKTPYVVMKYAMTADGKIATYSGKSKWITGDAARQKVQEDRNRYSAIMVGIGTVLADNPLLTCRIGGGRNPVRIICDSLLRTPLDSKILKTAKDVRTIIATSVEKYGKQKLYEEAGCEILCVPDKNGRVDLKALMRALGEMGIDSVYIEGGATLNWSALEAGIVNRVQTYIAPKIFGGTEAKSPVGGRGVKTPEEAYRLSAGDITVIGQDILIESEVIPCLQE